MSKLLRTDFARLIKNKLFYLALLVMTGLSIFMVVMRYTEIKKYSELYSNLDSSYRSVDAFLFAGPIYEIIVAAVLLGAFIGTDFSYGTIRNKLIAGHKRINIYLSGLIVCAVATIILNSVYSIITLIVGGSMLGIDASFQKILLFIALDTVALVCFAALYLFVVVVWASRSAGLASVILIGFIMIMAALTIENKLMAPEYYPAQAVRNEDTGEIIEMPPEKNLHYLTGTKRKVYEALYDMLPSCQIYRGLTMNDTTKDCVKMMVLSLMQIVLISGIGIFIFSGKNLK